MVMPERELSRLLNGMSPDDRTALLEREPPDEIERLLELLGPEEQRIARSLLSYGSGTVGRLMTPDFVAIKRRLERRAGAGARSPIRAKTARRSTLFT